MIGFGLGVLLGAILSFNAGRRYQSAHEASILASGYVSAAQTKWKAATGSFGLFIVVVLLGVVIMAASR
jgi:hypothetical protein